MKLSSKYTERLYENNEQVDNEVQSFQQGGSATLKSLIKNAPISKHTPVVQIDNARVVPGKHIPLAVKNNHGQYMTTENVHDNGSITKDDKSPREKLMSVMTKMGNVGNGALTGLISSPVNSGLKLLRPDKYFKGVQSDAGVRDAVLGIAGDAANVAANVYGSSAYRVGREAITAGREAATPYLNAAKSTFKATGDLPMGKRLMNSANSGTLAKTFAGDVNSHRYFHMSPEETAAKMAGERTKIGAGNMQTEGSLSLNSSPLMWGQAAKQNKGWTTIRNGEIQATNMSGTQGKRVFNAVPDKIKAHYTQDIAAIGDAQAQLKKLKPGMPKEMYDRFAGSVRMESNELNSNMLQRMQGDSMLGGKSHTEFLTNYKGTMDAGVEAVNAKTGLNFPMHEIDGLGYNQPNIAMVKGMKSRYKMVGKEWLQNTKDHMSLNQEIKTGLKEMDPAWVKNMMQLKKDASWKVAKPNVMRANIDYQRRLHIAGQEPLPDVGAEWPYPEDDQVIVDPDGSWGAGTEATSNAHLEQLIRDQTRMRWPSAPANLIQRPQLQSPRGFELVSPSTWQQHMQRFGRPAANRNYLPTEQLPPPPPPESLRNTVL